MDSGSPARDDGYLRKAGFRYDKELESDLNFTLPVDLPRDDSSMFWILRTAFFISRIQPEPLLYLLLLLMVLASLPAAHPSYVDPATLPPLASYSSNAALFWAAPTGLISYPGLPGRKDFAL